MVPFPTSLKRFPRVRQSRLATFDRCALSSKFESDLEEGWSSHPQARGSLTHRVLAECLRTMHREGERTISPDVALAIFYEQLRMGGLDRQCPTCGAPARFDPEQQAVLCARGHANTSDLSNVPISEAKDIRWIVIKFARDNSFDIDNLVDVEQRLRTTIQYPDGQGGHVDRELTGALDALFIFGDLADHAVVLDWKDTWQLPAPTEVGFDGYFQQRFYAWLVMKNYPTVHRVTLREMYVRYSEPREADVWRGDLDHIEQELSALVERFDRAYEEQNFPPSPGRHCIAMCPAPEDCPIFPRARRQGAIQNQEDALTFARRLAVTEGVVSQLTEALQTWVGVHGPVPVSDHKGPRVYGFHERQRTSRPTKDEMAKALRLAGVKTIDLDELYPTSTVTRFDQHQPDGRTDLGQQVNDGDLLAALEASIQRPADG